MLTLEYSNQGTIDTYDSVKMIRLGEKTHVRSQTLPKPMNNIFNMKLCTNIALNKLLEETSKKRMNNCKNIQ